MRLFVALDLSVAVHEQLEEILSSLKVVAPKAKWVPSENIHLTLSFLGEIAEERVPELVSALNSVASRHPSITLHTAPGGSFGSRHKPRVLWVGLEGDLEGLRALQHDVAQAMVAFGVEEEHREYTPHLTLARARDPRGDPTLADCLEPLAKVEPVESESSELMLVRSHLSSKGSRYEVVHRAKLERSGR